MRTAIKTIGFLSLSAMLVATGCKKKDNNSDTIQVSQAQTPIANPVSNSAPISGSVKGTMVSGNTYTINGDLVVNAGDTLFLQEDVHVCVSAKASITVKGSLISLGTKAKPNWFTVCGIAKQDNASQAALSDPAYSGKWYGINCDTSCKLCIIKWTHVEYTGAVINTLPVIGLNAGGPSFAVFFQNINGTFVFEDSWIYGSADDAVHVNSGKFSIMRNTFEKQGFNSGESVNVKSGCVGDIAYNLFIGGATNAIKASNSGATAIQGNINTYNNTIISNGFRAQTYSGHGACINYEKGVKGSVYNNLLVNCRTGFRVVNTADTINMQYGNTYHYGDSLSLVNVYYPAGDVTHPKVSDVPSPYTGYLPGAYALGQAFTAPVSYAGQGNPLFVNFPLPDANFRNHTYAAGFDFHLQSGSPAIGKGYTGFNALSVVAMGNTGASEITQPGADAGCYQSNGKGNQH